MKSAATNALNVLLVENHAATRDLMRLYLEDLGFSVLTAETKAEAIAAASASHWDVLISDIGLPDGSGWELMEEHHFKKSVFAIAMSGFGSGSDQRRSAAAGFRQHILKPFDMDELDEALAQAAAEAGKRSAS